MEAVEVVFRQHLNVHRMQKHQPDTDVHSTILEDALKSESVLSYWETIAKCIPPKTRNVQYRTVEGSNLFMGYNSGSCIRKRMDNEV